jgi:hypothetical protein
MKILKLTAFLILISNLTAYFQNIKSNEQTEVLDSWKTLTASNYSIEYPENWELNKSGQMGTNFILLSPLTSDQDQFKENVNLLIQDLTGYNLDLDQYVEISEGQVNTMITDGNIIESERISNSDINYHKLIYTGKQGIYDLKFEQYFWVIENKAYVLTLTTEEEQFDSFQKIGERILNSFEIRNN